MNSLHSRHALSIITGYFNILRSRDRKGVVVRPVQLNTMYRQRERKVDYEIKVRKAMRRTFLFVNLVFSSWAFVSNASLLPAQVRQEWADRYFNVPGLFCYSVGASAIAIDADGNPYVTGRGGAMYRKFCDSGVYSTIKYDPSGARLWITTYRGTPAIGGASARAIAIDKQGNIYVTGSSYQGAPPRSHYTTIKYNSNGALAWIALYLGPANSYDSATAIAVDPNNNVYVTGSSTGLGTGRDYATIKYDANGNEVWAARYNGPGNDDDIATALALDAKGNVYVTGYSPGPGTGQDYATIKYDAKGNEVWVARYNGPDNSDDVATTLVLDAEGNAYVTGYSPGPDTGRDYATIKYDVEGNEVWAARYNGPGNGDDIARALAVATDGHIYVTGSSANTSRDSDYATIQYDTDGNEIWIARYHGPAAGTNSAYAMAVDADGNVYVTGASASKSSGSAYATIKYDGAGDQQWAIRYEGGVIARAIAVDKAGNVYVTGSARRGSAGVEYATVKYSQQ